MENLSNRVIGELVAENYKTATVFKNHKIDFCCQGGRTVLEACEKKGVNISELMTEIDAVISEPVSEAVDYQSWPLDLLVDYIEKKHHRYVEKRSQEIKPFLDKLCRVHGERHPELLKINELFTGAIGELAQHMKKEELILFPYVRKIVDLDEDDAQLDQEPHFGTVENPINAMRHEHNVEGVRFQMIEELSNGYTPPSDGCNTYKVTFALLKEFEDDLHMHIHLENNILFPRVLVLEKQIKNRAAIK